jgi:hypothetical protein
MAPLRRLLAVPATTKGTRRERIATTLAAIAAAFESLIADAPEQWSAVFFPIWPDLDPGATPGRTGPVADTPDPAADGPAPPSGPGR